MLPVVRSCMLLAATITQGGINIKSGKKFGNIKFKNNFVLQSTFVMHDNISNNPLETLKEIRKVMQQSTRIFSLSGWSGIWAGSVALAGTAWIGYVLSDFGRSEMIALSDFDAGKPGYDARPNRAISADNLQVLFYSVLAIFVLAVIGAVFFSYAKSKKEGHAAGYNSVARKLLINMAIPIGTGAAFLLKFATEMNYHYFVPVSLAFYGLALINCSKYTFTEIKYLGLLEVLLGLLALFLMRWHLWIWGTGFGLLHIIYGILMWYKYDKR